MKLFIGLVTPDAVLRDFVSTSKGRVIPRDALYRLGAGISADPHAYSPKAHPSQADLESYLIRHTYNHQICLLLVDQRWEALAANCRYAAFTLLFDAQRASANPQNFFQSQIAVGLRNLSRLVAQFNRGTDAKLLRLPLRNFAADELAEMSRLIREQTTAVDLIDNVETQLARLRSRVRPRSRSSFATNYIVDDKKRLFVYGHEKHARADTGGEHRPCCEFTNRFRFGYKLEDQRHYNVSEGEGDDTSIKGTFLNCHDQQITAERATHLNMFPNDFF